MRNWLVIFFLTSLLAGCGGGGDGGGDGGGGNLRFGEIQESRTYAPLQEVPVSLATPPTTDEFFKATWELAPNKTYTQNVYPIGGQLSLTAPLGRLIPEGFSEGPVRLQLERIRGTQKLGEMSALINVGPLVDSPLRPGELVTLSLGLQAYQNESAARKAFEAGFITTPQRVALIASTKPPAASEVLSMMSAEQVRYAEKILYANFRSLGVSLTTSPQISSDLKSGGFQHGLNFDDMDSVPKISSDFKSDVLLLNADLFNIAQIAEQMGSTARQVGKGVMTAGGIALAGGLIVSSTPLAVGGAIAIAVGLGVGTANGLIYDNAGFIGGLEDKPRLIDTIKYFGSSVFSNIISAVLPFQPVGNKLSQFVQDQTLSYAVGEFSDRLVEGTASAYQFATTYATQIGTSVPSAGFATGGSGSTTGGSGSTTGGSGPITGDSGSRRCTADRCTVR